MDDKDILFFVQGFLLWLWFVWQGFVIVALTSPAGRGYF